MKKSQRFLPIEKLAKNQEQKSAEALAQVNKSLAEMEQQLANLQQYKADYQVQFGQQSQQGLTGTQLQRYHRFLQQLDQAIAQQEAKILACKQSKQQVHQQWRKDNTRFEAVNTLRTRSERQEAKLKDKEEQKAQDDRRLTQSPFDVADKENL